MILDFAVTSKVSWRGIFIEFDIKFPSDTCAYQLEKHLTNLTPKVPFADDEKLSSTWDLRIWLVISWMPSSSNYSVRSSIRTDAARSISTHIGNRYS
jgi:hypothetical protein